MSYNLNINLDKYPVLQKFKKTELDQIIETIFNTGYETIFPSKISSDPLVGKITSLETTLERLLGIGSSKKGALAEVILESHIKSRYGDIMYQDMSQISHSGDAHILIDNTNVILESKNYINKINKDEIAKMKYDMIHTNMRWGIFISWASTIIDKKEFDIEIFHEKGAQYFCIYVYNLLSDIDRLDLAIQLIRKLIKYTDMKNGNITWIYNMIQNDIDRLNDIISKNYQLRIWFEEMETNTHLQMNRFYTKMRDYMYEMDNTVKEIIDRITNTTTLSIETNHSIYNSYLDKYKDNKKLFPILSKLLDVFKEFKIIINEDNILINDEHIGIIKVMAKKITVYWNKYMITSELGLEPNIESFNMIKLIGDSYL